MEIASGHQRPGTLHPRAAGRHRDRPRRLPGAGDRPDELGGQHPGGCGERPRRNGIDRTVGRQGTMLPHILESTKLFYPELALSAAFCAVVLADLVFKGNRTLTSLVGMAGVLVALYLVATQAPGEHSAFSDMLAVDGFSRFFKIVILASTFIVQLFSVQSAELKSRSMGTGEYSALLTALALGMSLMAGASNMLMMYLALELTSLTS